MLTFVVEFPNKFNFFFDHSFQGRHMTGGLRAESKILIGWEILPRCAKVEYCPFQLRKGCQSRKSCFVLGAKLGTDIVPGQGIPNGAVRQFNFWSSRGAVCGVPGGGPLLVPPGCIETDSSSRHELYVTKNPFKNEMHFGTRSGPPGGIRF